jgi:hypothetical protein
MHKNKRRQTHTQNHDTPLRWKPSKDYDAAWKISTRIARRAGNAGMCVNDDTSTKVV